MIPILKGISTVPFPADAVAFAVPVGLARASGQDQEGNRAGAHEGGHGGEKAPA